MYFTDRVQAGRLLAKELISYKGKKCTLVALSDGAVVVAAQIATSIQAPITMLIASPINAPGEPEPVASIGHTGIYSTNSGYTTGQHEEFNMEYRHVFEQQKLDRLSEMHRLLGRNEIIRKDLLRGRIVILVSDGMGDVTTIDAAVLFLKSIRVKKLIIVTPLATIGVVDRMHILGDEIVCLSPLSNFMGVDHYYEHNQLPDHQTIIGTVQDVVRRWKR